MKPTISGLDYYLGDLESIETLAGTPEEAEAINTLTAVGLEKYSRSRLRIADMAAASIRGTIERSGILPADVDAVVFATESTWDFESNPARRDNYRQLRTALFKTIWEAGLTRAYPVGVMHSGCGNLVTAISTASNMIRAQGLQNVLVVVADRHPEGASRIMFPAVGVVSDAAASCLVTSRPVPGFVVDDVILNSNLGLWETDLEREFGRFLVEMARGMKDMGKGMVAQSGSEPRDYKFFLPNNYSRSTLRVFCHQLGYQQSQLYLDNIPRVSHAFAADVLINLSDLDAAGKLSDGDRVMSLTSGPAMWGMIGFTKRTA